MTTRAAAQMDRTMQDAQDMSRVSPDGKPWFRLRCSASGTQACGQSKALSGVRIEGEVDADERAFVEWHYDGEVKVENDRYGIYPLFYCGVTGDAGRLATSVLCDLAAS